ncbi:SGNH/GDSL hydrolase family protein [Acidobacteria bacterium AB60]|nr:SGNH/GDSL hydrolase family protein [Acidobacteria bacterium AB60]
MRLPVRTLALIGSCALATLSASAQQPAYSAIYAFGDSAVDVGNAFLATGGQNPAPPYFNGHFSNGPIWIEHLAGSLGLPILPALAGGTDYAVGGAEVTAPVPYGGQTIPSVPQQVEEYLVQHGGKADPHALYVIEGGGNDILNAPSGANPASLGFQVATGIAQSVVLLRQAGARRFLIPNVANVAYLPAAAANPTFAAAASTATDKWLDTLLALEQHLPGVSIRRVNAYRLLNAIENTPTHFGFTNVTTPCLTTVVCADPDHTLFWDAFHFTEFGQSLFAVAAEDALADE